MGSATGANCRRALSWGQAPALHFSWGPGLSLFGRRRLVSPAGAGIHSPTNRSCRMPPAHQGMKMTLGRWRSLGVIGATPPLWIPAPYRGTGHAFDRRNDEEGGRNDEAGAGGIQAYLRPRNTIFVPKTAWGKGMTQRMAGT